VAGGVMSGLMPIDRLAGGTACAWKVGIFDLATEEMAPLHVACGPRRPTGPSRCNAFPIPFDCGLGD